MEMNNTQSKDRLTPEEAKNLMAKMEAYNQKNGTSSQCRMITANIQDVIPPDIETGKKDVTTLKVVKAPQIIDATFKKKEKEDSFMPISAAEIKRSGVRILTDAEMGRAEQVAEVPENETLQASREQAELERRAQEKYEQNNEGDR